MKRPLEGQNVLVTGASSGIGRAIAIAAAEAGAEVGINYRSDKDGAEECARRIAADGGRAHLLPADVSKPAEVERLFGEADRLLGRIDVVVANAGINGERERCWEISIEDWRKPVEVNLFGTFYCVRQALQRMVPQRGGVILAITSVHELVPWAGHSAYTAAKAGVAMMVKSLALEASPYGVRVLAIAPGAIDTPLMTEDEGGGDSDSGDNQIPLKRVGQPEEIARLAVALASDAGAYVTGTSVFADGGMAAYPSFAYEREMEG
ncbi:SDR family oxidoreductase [soil metagenome]